MYSEYVEKHIFSTLNFLIIFFLPSIPIDFNLDSSNCKASTIFLLKASAEALSKKIVEALQLDESRLKSIGIEGRKNIIKKFNVEKMCFSTYSEYKKLLN